MKVVVRLRMRIGSNPHDPPPPTVELEEPKGIPHQGVQSDLHCSADESLIAKFRQAAPDDTDTAGVGALVYDALVENPGVKAALELLVANGRGGLVLDIVGDEIERLPWESLYPSGLGKFLALTDWPIERRVSDVMMDPPRQLPIGEPVRVAAVLGASSYDAIGQWKALEALYDGPADVDLFVAASDMSVLSAVTPGPKVTLHPILHDGKIPLWDAIEAFDPHVLHLFCHGHAGSDPYLEVATVADKTADAKGSIALYPSDLVKMTGDAATLAVLGCCEGAAPSETSRAFGRQLVKERFHAAIGMSEKASFADLDQLAAVFYPKLGKQLTAALDDLVWRDLLVAPRQKLVDQLGPPPRMKTSKRWVAPVLFTRGAPLELVNASLSLEARKDIARLEGFLPLATAEERPVVLAMIEKLKKGGG